MSRRPPPAPPEPWRGPVAGGTVEIVPDKHRTHAAELFLDGTPQSHVDLADPTYLAYEYVRHIGDVLDLAFPERQPIDVLHLGGGGLTLPRYVATTRPRSRQRVVEWDATLVEVIRQRLPLPAGSGIKISTGDARELLTRIRPQTFDAVVVDVYAGPRMPKHLASREALALAADTLRPPGLLVLNVADGRPLAFARGMTTTVCDVLTPVGVISDAAVWRGRRFGNLVVAAGPGCPPWQALQRRLSGGPFPARLVTDADLATFVSGAKIVTDATAAPSPSPPPDAFD